jgi:hypothetical protein
MSDGGGDVSDSSGKTDGGTDADAALLMCGTATSGGSGDGCNTVVPMGDCIVETVSTDTPPTAAGGTIVAGTYELVAATVYASADGGVDAAAFVNATPARETSVVTGSGSSFTFQNAQVSGTAAARVNGSLTTNGTSPFSVTPTCPVVDGGGGGATVDYTITTTAAGTMLTTFSVDSGHLHAKVYKVRN